MNDLETIKKHNQAYKPITYEQFIQKLETTFNQEKIVFNYGSIEQKSIFKLHLTYKSISNEVVFLGSEIIKLGELCKKYNVSFQLVIKSKNNAYFQFYNLEDSYLII